MADTDSRYEAGRKDGRIQDLMAEYEKVCDSLQDVEICFPFFVFENPEFYTFQIPYVDSFLDKTNRVEFSL
jgi:hypothetical protein